MRFDELVLKMPDDEFRVRFHPRFTVLSGLDPDERRALVEGLVGALDGSAEDAALRFVDLSGRIALAVVRDGTAAARHEDDQSAAVLPARVAVRDLVVLTGADVSSPSDPHPDDPPELREARESLAALTAELEAAANRQREVVRLRSELARVDERLVAARDGRARREYARALSELERVRAEAAALQSGAEGAEADRRLLVGADDVRAAAAAWKADAARLADVSVRLGKAERVEASELAAAADIPDSVPPALEVLLAELAAAERERADLHHRLQSLAVARLPEPSDPLVAEIGHLDPRTLWSARDRAAATAAELERARIAIGGLDDDVNGPPGIVEDLETAHAAVEAAEVAAEDARTPGLGVVGGGVTLALIGLLGPMLFAIVGVLVAIGGGIAFYVRPRAAVVVATARERAALERAGAPSYLGFHIRRVEATVDPELRERVDLAAFDHRIASQAWTDLVPTGLTPERATELEDEVRAYHDALVALGDTADEIHRLRGELTGRVESGLRDARAAVAAACRAYGVDPAALDSGDAALISRLVQHQVGVGRRARRQAELEASEAVEAASAARLDERLLRLGFDDGDLGARVAAFEYAVTRAIERDKARLRARPRADIEADLARLQDDVARLRRPEWALVTAAEATEPDIDELESARAAVAEALRVVDRETPDPGRLADRRAAVQRRIAALEARTGAGASPEAINALQERLLDHLDRSAQAGPSGDPLPVVLDDVLERVPAERKWDLLDLLHRRSEQHQVVYLSDDAFVAAWARGQTSTGELTLLEPVPENA